MSNGRPSRDPLRRPSGSTALRGGVILAVALVIGVVLVGSVEPSATTSSSVDTPAQPQQAEGGDVVDTTLVGSDGGVVAAPTTTEARHAPNLVRVLVVNGSGVNGVGARVRAQLLPGGWDLQEPRTGSASNLASFVYFRTGFQADAAYLATQVGLSATKVMAVPLELPVQTPPEVPGFDVLVVVGPDLAPRYAPAAASTAAAASATPTTRKVASASASTTVASAPAPASSAPAAPAATSATPATAATAATKVQARATNTAVVQN